MNIPLDLDGLFKKEPFTRLSVEITRFELT